MHLKVSGHGPTVVARELALVLGCASFRPDVFSHIPGIANVAADMLSRRYDPNKKFALPSLLTEVTETTAATRVPSWWRTRTPPAPHSKATIGELEASGKKPRITDSHQPTHTSPPAAFGTS